MDYQQYFLPYTRKINQFLDRFFTEKITQSKTITPVASEIWRNIQNFISGGKRIRGGLVKLGYECFKKPDEKNLLPISAALELTHGAILIHDDIIDQSEFRHNQPTVHKKYESEHIKRYQKGSASHYGEGMAIIAGIVGYYGAISLINQSKFPPDLKLKAIDQLANFMTNTGYGEGLDVDLACRQEIKEKDVLTIHTYKTAHYTFIGPLKIGGILAGAGEKELKKFEDYGLPLGIAFQLQDDILGLFGTEEKLGKPIGDDIKEGKNTLLYTQALKGGSPSQRKKLTSLWGKKEIAFAEIEEVRKIIKETDSLDYSQKMALQLVEKGKKIVPKITDNKKLQEVFLSLADFVVQRSK